MRQQRKQGGRGRGESEKRRRRRGSGQTNVRTGETTRDARTRARTPHAAGEASGQAASACKVRAGMSVGQFADLLAELGLGSCWGGRGELGGVWTTFSARTHLQPQGHKAVGPAAAGGAEHRRLRDWVVFPAGRAAAAGPAERDNTGRGALAEVRTVPSAAFPSDHAVVSVLLDVRHEGS